MQAIYRMIHHISRYIHTALYAACTIFLLCTTPLSSEAPAFVKRITGYFSGSQESIPQENIIPAKQIKRIILKVPAGSLTIHGSSQNDQISVRAVKHGSKEHVHELSLQQRTHNGTVTLSSSFDEKQGSIDIEVTVPQRLMVDAETQSGSITVDDVAGDIHAYTAHGSVTIEHARGRCIVKAPHGAISLSHTGIHTDNGSIMLEGYGPLSLTIPEHTDAELRAQTRSGTVTASLPMTICPHTISKLDGSYAKRVRKHVHALLNNGGPLITLEAERAITIQPQN